MQAYGEIAGAQYKVRLHNIDSVMDCGISVYSPTIGRRNAMLCERSAGYNMTSFLRQWRHLPYSDWLKSDRSATYRDGGEFLKKYQILCGWPGITRSNLSGQNTLDKSHDY
uniref:Uncharacterized protein n=1 Tax=Trichuris muris TaxID=70415 RepID=A0A5S6Q110_TRIMR